MRGFNDVGDGLKGLHQEVVVVGDKALDVAIFQNDGRGGVATDGGDRGQMVSSFFLPELL